MRTETTSKNHLEPNVGTGQACGDRKEEQDAWGTNVGTGRAYAEAERKSKVFSSSHTKGLISRLTNRFIPRRTEKLALISMKPLRANIQQATEGKRECGRKRNRKGLL